MASLFGQNEALNGVENELSFENEASQCLLFSCDRTILSFPYEMGQKCFLFKELYGHLVGVSVQGKRPSIGYSVGIDPNILSVALNKLGFVLVDELRANSLVPEDGRKLNALFLTTSKVNLPQHGSNFLTIKPFVGRMYKICTKWCFVQSLRRLGEKMCRNQQSYLTRSGRVFSHKEFTPFTLNLNNKDLEDILAEQPGVYLAKPTQGSMGQRQQLVRIRSDRVQKDLLAFLVSSEFTEMRRSQVILQRYIERPLLVDKRKFDLRVYMLVVNGRRDRPTSGDLCGGDSNGQSSEQGMDETHGYFVFMHPGFVRLCITPYDPEQTDLAAHLTNQSVQAKRSSLFSLLKEVTTWYPDELNDYLNRRKRLPIKNWTKKVLYPKIGAILGYISNVFRNYLDDHECSSNTFRILGLDFLVDDHQSVYLLECNSYPSWGRQTSVLNRLKPNLWREATCVTSEVILRYRCGQPVRDECLVTRQNFRLVYSSEDPEMARKLVAKHYD